MDRVINIQPVFVDYDISETVYDSLFIKIFLSILLIITTFLLITYFWDEMAMMVSIIFNMSTVLSKEEHNIMNEKVKKIDELLNTSVQCLTIDNITKLEARSENKSYFLLNLDGSEMTFQNERECYLLLSDLDKI